MSTITSIGVFILAACIIQNDALVKSPPRIVKQPPTDELLFKVAMRATENDVPFIIECEAEGEPSPKYRWIKNGKDFHWQTYDDRMLQQPGRGTLVISSPRDEDLGQYQCFAENEWGIATSNSVFVRKAELNSFKDKPRQRLVAQEGVPFKLTCEPPDGWPKPSVYWLIEPQSSGVQAINDSRMSLDPEGNLWFTNVTKEDASIDSTYTCAATSPDRNEFKLGNRVYLIVESSGMSSSQNKHELVQQYVTRRNDVAYRGREANIYCIFGGTPLPQVVWQKDGVLLTSSERITQQNYGRSIRIKHVSYEDKGKYTCEVSNGAGPAKSYTINLDVLAIPYFTVEPESQTPAEDEEVEIRCEASGVPEPKISWIHNGKPIAEAPPNDRRIVTSNSIIIKNLVKKDTGNYGCNATNSLGYVYKDITINILALQPEISEAPAPLTTTVNGRKETLKCRVTGAPKPLVKWLRGGKELTGGRFTIDSDGNLHIQDVAFADADIYTCNAVNKFGEASAVGELKVKEHTRITVKPEDYYIAVGKQVNFRCNAITDPELTLTIEWLNKGKSIDFDNEPRFVQSNDNTLTITKTIELDSGEYTCVARTDLDQATAKATLFVQDVPNAPVIENIECGNREAGIEWHPMGDNRAPITHYTIQYNTSFTPDTWNTAYENVPATDMKYSVYLSPWANYTFRVLASNDIGSSLPSAHSSMCTTQPDVPFKNPDKVEGKGSDPTNLKISWSPMPEIEHNAPGFQYRVFWKRDIPGEDWNTEDIFNWEQSELIIRDQPTFKPYKIKVVAINEKGESNVTPVEVVGYSGEDSPLEAPGNFTLVQVTASTSALLSWTPVSPESVRGHFEGYRIQTWTDKGGEASLREINVIGDAVSTLVTKFAPHSKNYARILVHNGGFNGPPSNTLSFDTPEGTPGSVQAFDAYQMGSSALYLTWKKPEQTNGVLTGYRITYQEMQGSDAGLVIGSGLTITDGRQTRAKLAGLKPNTKYRITIKATTRAGEGEEYFIEQKTKLGGAVVPDVPNFRVSASPSPPPSSGLTNIRVTWLPTLDGRSGSHFFVKYKLKDEPAYESTNPELNNDSLVIRGLPPGIYEIITVAVDGEYLTESKVQEVDTSGIGSEGPIIQHKENVATAGWFIGMMLAIAFLLLVLILVCVIKRNRGGKYDVHDRELANGRKDYPDEGGFHEYQQPLDNKSRHSMSSGLKGGPESDTDSMAEYGEGETGRFTEDGSFIGQYVPGAMKPLSGGLGPVSSAHLSPNASHTSVHSPTNTQHPTYV